MPCCFNAWLKTNMCFSFICKCCIFYVGLMFTRICCPRTMYSHHVTAFCDLHLICFIIIFWNHPLVFRRSEALGFALGPSLFCFFLEPGVIWMSWWSCERYRNRIWLKTCGHVVPQISHTLKHTLLYLFQFVFVLNGTIFLKKMNFMLLWRRL